MQLSIIVPIYREVDTWTAFFEMFEQQSKADFELIIVVDTHLGNPLAAIEAHYASARDFWQNRLKVIFNVKRTGRSEAVKQGIAEATGQYTLILSNSDEVVSNFMAKASQILKSATADVIEFDIYARKPVRFKWSPPEEFATLKNVGDTKALFAYVSPFEFNKFFRTSVLKKAARLKLKTATNSRYSIEHTYTALILAESYLAVPVRLVVAHARVSLNFDPLKLLRQWKALLTFLNENLAGDFYNEWAYAFASAHLDFISQAVKETKRSFRHKYQDALSKELKQLNLSENFYFHGHPKLISAVGKY